MDVGIFSKMKTSNLGGDNTTFYSFLKPILPKVKNLTFLDINHVIILSLL